MPLKRVVGLTLLVALSRDLKISPTNVLGVSVLS